MKIPIASCVRPREQYGIAPSIERMTCVSRHIPVNLAEVPARGLYLAHDLVEEKDHVLGIVRVRPGKRHYFVNGKEVSAAEAEAYIEKEKADHELEFL